MKEKKLLKRVAQELTSLLESNRFERVRGDDFRARRSVPGGFNELSMIVTDYGGEYNISFVLEIRMDRVEALRNAVSDADPADFDQTTTFMVMQGVLMGLMEKQYYIKAPEDVSDSCRDFVSFMEETGLAFFQRYSDLEQMDRAINAQPSTKHPFFLDELDRACVGITLAKLTGRTNFDLLIRDYRATLDGWDEMFVEEFDRLADSLLNR